MTAIKLNPPDVFHQITNAGNYNYEPVCWVDRAYVPQGYAQQDEFGKYVCVCTLCLAERDNRECTDYTFILAQHTTTREYKVFAGCNALFLPDYREHTESYGPNRANKRAATLAILDAFEAYIAQQAAFAQAESEAQGGMGLGGTDP